MYNSFDDSNFSFTSRKKCIEWILSNTPREIATVTLPLGDPRRKLIHSGYKDCVPSGSWDVLTGVAPESTLRVYTSNTEQGLSFTSPNKFMKYLREHRPDEYAATMVSRKES